MRRWLALVSLVALAGFLPVAMLDAAQSRRRPRQAPPVEEQVDETDVEDDTGPTYLEVWVRIYDGTDENGAPKYRVQMTSECGEVSTGVGGCTYAGAEAEFQRIIDTGWYRIGTEAYPIHMIERVRFHTYAPKP